MTDCAIAKPLVWEDEVSQREDGPPDPTGNKTAETLAGRYYVEFDDDDGLSISPWNCWAMNDLLGRFADRDEAMSAAQADHEARIRDAIDLSLLDRIETLEGVLKPFADAIARYEAHYDDQTGGQQREPDDESVDYLGWLGDYFTMVTLGDFREARRALADEAKP